MHRVVRLFFWLCLVPVSEQSASIGPPAENYSKLNVIHSMRRDAGRGKPDSLKQLPPGLSHGLLSAARHGALALLWQVQAQTSQQPSARAQLAAALSSDEFAVWRPCSLALGAPPTTYRSPIRGTGCSLGGGGSPHGKYRAGTRRQHSTTRLGGAPVGSVRVLEHIPSGRIRRLGPQALP